MGGWVGERGRSEEGRVGAGRMDEEGLYRQWSQWEGAERGAMGQLSQAGLRTKGLMMLDLPVLTVPERQSNRTLWCLLEPAGLRSRPAFLHLPDELKMAAMIMELGRDAGK